MLHIPNMLVDNSFSQSTCCIALRYACARFAQGIESMKKLSLLSTHHGYGEVLHWLRALVHFSLTPWNVHVISLTFNPNAWLMLYLTGRKYNLTFTRNDFTCSRGNKFPFWQSGLVCFCCPMSLFGGGDHEDKNEYTQYNKESERLKWFHHGGAIELLLDGIFSVLAVLL